ncbi:amidase family protein [Prosthecomicrobium sp. N25]|uniref:amidase family protein n=1 Tax=Prosthecomicrobium sp. N25 TaxID=3129254 RepID=UPI003077B90C
MARPEPTVRARLESILAAIEAAGGDGGRAFRKVHAAEARAAADAADARAAAGSRLGPLDGCLVSVKELFDIAGETTTAGSRLRLGAPPAAEDAEVVRRLRAAGAILVGRTAMSEFAFSGVGINPHFGTPGNPADPDRIPGGSSSGAAATIGAGYADLAIGSDTGGSSRIPPALCGHVGLKPSTGRIPIRGAFPLSTTLDTVGLLAGSVGLARAAFSVLADGAGAPPGAPDPARLRLGLVRSPRLLAETEPEILAAFVGACGRLSAAGAAIEEVGMEDLLDGIAGLNELGTFPGIELAATLKGEFPARAALMDPLIVARLERMLAVPALDYVLMQRRRAALLEAVRPRFRDLDALILPTVPIRAPRIADLADPAAFARANLLLLRNTIPANILDLPSASVPLPMPAGSLPAGLMLMGASGTDETLWAVAETVEAVLARPAAAA